jgi:predicted MFS family arabinose efflux permease
LEVARSASDAIRPRRTCVTHVEPAGARRSAARHGLAVALLFAGQFAIFTYFRPFLDEVHVGVSQISLVLLGMGLAGVVGNALVGRLIGRSLTLALIAVPLALAILAVALVVLKLSPPVAALALALWGMVGTSAPWRGGHGWHALCLTTPRLPVALWSR